MLADGTQWTKRYKDTKHTITKYSKEGKLRKLIKHLADSKNHKYINVQDDAGRTAVNFVASWDCPKTLAKLLRVPDVDVNMRDEEGKPLFEKSLNSTPAPTQTPTSNVD